MNLQSKGESNYNFIHYLRTIAMLLILWDHLVPAAYYGMGVQPPASIVERYIIWPLAITNYFGAFGVDLFFLITGFLTLFALKKTGVISFLLKRILRLGPAVAFGYVLYYILIYIFKILGYDAIINFSSYWGANGALWYLRVLVCFYIIFTCFIPLFRKSIFGGITLCQIMTILLCELAARSVLTFSLGNTCSYIFYITIGMAIYMLFVKKAFFLKFLLQLIVSWYGIVHYNIAVFNPERAATGNSFGVSAMYAFLIFLVFFLADNLLPNNIAFQKVSDYSYGMYIHHMPIFSIVLPFMRHSDDGQIKVWCYTAIAITVILTIAASYMQNKWIEPSCTKLLKNILGRLDNGRM